MFLKQFGFPADKKGYHYLRAAIMIEVNNPTIRDNGTNLVYALVTNQYQTTAGPIENAITRAIHDMMYRRQDNADMINLYFGNATWNWNTGSPENSDVIAILADALRSKLNSN
jgi:two-component system response regulator (stage 0 sporulation protein A)